MATKDQMRALLAVPCTWCGAQPGKRCVVRMGGRVRLVPSTLDGESHDARWQKAFGMTAPVLTTKAEQYHAGREPKQIAASGFLLERPW